MISRFQVAAALIVPLVGICLAWDESFCLMLAILVLGLAPLAECLFRPVLDPLSPGVLLPPIYCFYALGPLVGFNSDPHIINTYLLLQLFGLISMRIGVQLGEAARNPIRKATPVNWNSDLHWLKITLIVFGILSVPSAWSEVAAFGGPVEYVKMGYGAQRFAALEENAHFGGGVVWLIIFFELAAYYCFKTSRKRLAWLCLAGYFMLVFIQLRVGARGTIVLTLLAGVYAYHYEYRRIAAKWIVPSLLTAACVSQFLSLARAFLDRGVGASLVQGFDVVRRAPNLLLPWAGGEARSPAASLLEILVNGGPPLQWGKTYLGALSGMIPFLGRIVQSAFLDPNVWRLQTFAPVELAIHGGLGFSPVTEAYMNFGAPGVCVIMGLYGYTSGVIVRRYRERPSCASVMLLCLSLPLFYLDGLRIHSASFIFKWIRTYLAPLVLFFVLKGKSRPATSEEQELTVFPGSPAPASN